MCSVECGCNEDSGESGNVCKRQICGETEAIGVMEEAVKKRKQHRRLQSECEGG